MGKHCPVVEQEGTPTTVETPLGSASVTTYESRKNPRIQINPTATCALRLVIMERYANIAAISELPSEFAIHNVACFLCGRSIDASINLLEVPED